MGKKKKYTPGKGKYTYKKYVPKPLTPEQLLKKHLPELHKLYKPEQAIKSACKQTFSALARQVAKHINDAMKLKTAPAGKAKGSKKEINNGR